MHKGQLPSNIMISLTAESYVPLHVQWHKFWCEYMWILVIFWDSSSYVFFFCIYRNIWSDECSIIFLCYSCVICKILEYFFISRMLLRDPRFNRGETHHHTIDSLFQSTARNVILINYKYLYALTPLTIKSLLSHTG